jgi:heparan-alpha-glucosaminide N-acetyltransferase
MGPSGVPPSSKTGSPWHGAPAQPGVAAAGSSSIATPVEQAGAAVAAQTARLPTVPGRLVSIDLLRGLDVVLMLFVNEMAGVSGAPAFLLHVSSGTDGMALADVVFPAFLFITGMSIPLALERRLARGQTRLAIWRHVATRSVALVVMGVFMVNAEQGIAAGWLSPPAWNILMTLALLVVWTERPDGRSTGTTSVIRAAGLAALVALAFVYRSTDIAGPVQFTPRWWGILGLIGWAYLVAASACLLVGRRPAALVGCVALLYCLYLADAGGGTSWLSVVRPYFAIGSLLGSHAAIAVSGAVLTTLLREHDAAGRPRTVFVGTACAYGLALAAAGLLLHELRHLHQAFWINKPLATPAWGLLSAAATCAAWVLVFVAADVRGWRRWPNGLLVAGQNALLAYLLAPLLLSLFALGAGAFGGSNPYHALGDSTVAGTVRSAVFAWAVVRLTGWLRGRGVVLRL